AFSHYYFSLRVLDETGFRYMLPLMLLGVIMAGILLAELWDAVPRAAHWAATLVIVTLLGICTVRAVELLWLIRTDPRYAAEAWLQEDAARCCTKPCLPAARRRRCDRVVDSNRAKIGGRTAAAAARLPGHELGVA